MSESSGVNSGSEFHETRTPGSKGTSGKGPRAITVPQAHIQPHGVYLLALLFVRTMGRLLFGLGAHTVSGREHIPASGGFIMVSNHASHLDPPITALASTRQMTYLAKIELFATPWFAWGIRKLGAYPVERGKGDRDAFDTAIALLKAGHGLVVFPEGTRTLTGKLGRVHIGASMMALKARVPVVPVHIKGSFEAWPKGGKIRPAKCRVRIGPPLAMDDLAADSKSYRILRARMQEGIAILVDD